MAVLLAVYGLSLSAQSSDASLFGTVLDPQARGLPGARITLRDPAKGTILQARSDGGGGFSFSAVKPSTYEVEVEHAGFQSSRYTAIVLNANTQQSLRIELKVEARSESVVVTSVAALVRESPSVATAVDRTFIENQPLNGRSFQSLIGLAPGIVSVPSTLPDQGQFSGQRPADWCQSLHGGRSGGELRSTVRDHAL